jgi:hypothetical protein
VPAALTARLPVAGYEAAGAELTVGIDPGYVRKLFEEMALDLLVVAVVTLFVSLELLYFLAGAVVADVGACARAAALSRGAFFRCRKPPGWGSVEQAMNARAAEITARYQHALSAFARAVAASYR